MARSPSGAITRSSRAQQEVDDEVSGIGSVVDDGRDRSDRTGYRGRADRRDADRRDGAERSYGQGSDIERAYNDFWWDYGNSITGDKRTSLIVDPPDGRIPWTPAGKQRPGTFAAAFSGILAAGPED